jgi:hypothetical protein
MRPDAEAAYACRSCGEEIVVPVDVHAGEEQMSIDAAWCPGRRDAPRQRMASEREAQLAVLFECLHRPVHVRKYLREIYLQASVKFLLPAT